MDASEEKCPDCIHDGGGGVAAARLLLHKKRQHNNIVILLSLLLLRNQIPSHQSLISRARPGLAACNHNMDRHEGTLARYWPPLESKALIPQAHSFPSRFS